MKAVPVPPGTGSEPRSPPCAAPRRPLAAKAQILRGIARPAQLVRVFGGAPRSLPRTFLAHILPPRSVASGPGGNRINDASFFRAAPPIRSCVRSCARSCIRFCVRFCVRSFVRSFVKSFVGLAVGSFVGLAVGSFVGLAVGPPGRSLIQSAGRIPGRPAGGPPAHFRSGQRGPGAAGRRAAGPGGLHPPRLPALRRGQGVPA